MQDNLTKVLKLINSLNKAQLLTLNKVIVTLIKQHQDTEIAEKSTEFRRGDIVSFVGDNNKKWVGVVLKVNLKSIQIITLDSYKFNVSPTYLKIEDKPGKKILDFKRILFP